jgi:uncharacterized protein YgbK (DUF1537 family)
MRWAGLADDLTGGLELAATLAEQGVATRFCTDAAGVADAGDAEAVVVAQKTRVAPPDEALARFDAAHAALARWGAGQWFFKYCATFDSTDRGNIGPCADLLLDRTGAPFTGYCPTFPAYARTVFQGHLFLGDRLVSESPKRHDPLTPMNDPDLVRVLQRQTSRRVGLVAHEVVRDGPAAVRRRVAELAGQGVRHLILDAIAEADLDCLAEATSDWPLMTGNSTLASHWPGRWRAAGRLGVRADGASLPPVAGAGVVLAGSCADRTAAQLARFGERRPVLRLDLEAALEDRQRVLETTLSDALGALRDGPVAIASTAPPEQVARLQARIGVDAAAALGEGLFGDLAVLLHARGVRRFAIAGGETSGAVLQRLGMTRLRVGPFAAPFLPVAVRDDGEPTAFCLKSGKLGPDEAFEIALRRMEQGS